MPIDLATTTDLTLPAILLVSITSLLLVASRNIRWLPLILGLQYVGVFLFTLMTWPVNLALVKLLAGGMVCLLISVGQMSTSEVDIELTKSTPSRTVFRVLIAIIVGLTMFSLSPRMLVWLPAASLGIIAGGMTLIGLGLLVIGLTDRILRIVMGLLTVLSGFEIIYASLENSILVAGLLAGLNIGIAFVGIYLQTVPGLEESE